MTTTSAPPVQLGRISLRKAGPGRAENALLTGGIQVGKSTLADTLRADYLYRYRALKVRCHISDTKPRYRAEWLPSGRPARHLYKKWDHGANVPGSVLVKTPEEMDLAWQLGYRVTICSSSRWSEEQDLCIAHFHDQARAKLPQLLDVDETKDHFYGNGMARGMGALMNVARAGNEKGESGLYCSQRTKGISDDLMEYFGRLYAFRMDNVKDAKRFQEFGAPEFELPRKPFQFKYWWKGDYDHVWGPYQLEL